jgi:hypothetical protein
MKYLPCPPPPIHPLSVLFFYMRKSQIEPNDNVTRDEFPQMKDNKGGQFFNEKSNRYFWSYISLNSSYKQLTCNSRQSVSAGSRIWLGKSQLYLYLFNAMPNSLHYITEERCRNSVRNTHRRYMQILELIILAFQLEMSQQLPGIYFM